MTVEAAISLLALTAVVSALVWAMSLLGAQLAVGEASRSAARAAARGEDTWVVESEATRLAPGAEVSVSRVGDRLEVEVVRVVRPPGALARLGSFRLSATTSAAREPGSETGVIP